MQTVTRAGDYGISLTELQNKYSSRYNQDYSRRTFNNHRNAIAEIFNVYIECRRSTNTYFISRDENGHTLGTEADRIIDTFAVNQLLSLSKQQLAGRVSVEEIPSGHLYLTSIMEAMINKKAVLLTYKKYQDEAASEYFIRPLAVKEFEKRWYLIADCLSKNGVELRPGRDKRSNAREQLEDLRIFGLDRIEGIEETDKKFKIRSDFDVDELFSTSFGIYLPSRPAKTIHFRTDEKEAKYLNDLPLHRSQKIIEQKDGMVTFEIFAVPDRNMLMTFCKYGSDIEVLSPAEVVEELKKETEKMYNLYHTKQ